MKRDKEIIKHHLQYIVENADGVRLPNVPNGDDLKSKFKVTDKEIHYHVELCVQAGLLKVVREDEPYKNTQIPTYGIMYLTWWGHEFLEGRSQKRFIDWGPDFGMENHS